MKSKPFVFDGPAVDLGRWGITKRGDVRWLTPKEAECVKDDRRFVAHQHKKHGPLPPMSAGERERLESLELAEMNLDDLKAYAAKSGISLRPRMTPRQILALVHNAVKHAVAGPPKAAGAGEVLV